MILKGRSCRQIRGKLLAEIVQIGRIQAKRQCVFLRNEEVGFQAMANERDGTAEDGAAKPVQKPPSGIVVLDRRMVCSRVSAYKPSRSPISGSKRT